MATGVQDFSNWLNEKLKELNTDETVFGFYIQGILDSDESREEKNEALQSILSEILENVSCVIKKKCFTIYFQADDILELCSEILDKWKISKSKETITPQCSNEDVDVKLAKLLESQSLATTKQKEYTAEEKKIREAILSQYGQMTDDEDEEDCPTESGGDTRLEKNLNSQTVSQAEKMKREQARVDSQKKKEKDKEDRLVEQFYFLITNL